MMLWGLRQDALAIGRTRKALNIAAALASCSLLTFFVSWRYPAIGFLAGIIWASAFEYVYHRVLLHGPLRNMHAEHHESFGRTDEPLHVSFGRSPAFIPAVFAFNLAAFLLLDVAGAGLSGGVLAAFCGYFIAFEELHWRIHLGRLPRWLEWLRMRHCRHHLKERANFNVVLPLWDWLLGTTDSGERGHGGREVNRCRHQAKRCG